jgi:subtilisin family serine protease
MQTTLNSSFQRFRRVLLGILLITLVIGGLLATPHVQPAAAQPYIVQGADYQAVQTAVAQTGAEITHELALIDGVGARLTAQQAAMLAENSAVTALHADNTVQVAGGEKLFFITDDFNDVAYDNDDGTVSWNSDWEEFNDWDGPFDGDVRIMDVAGEMALTVDNTNNWVQRAADLSEANYARLHFSYLRHSIELPEEYVVLEISSDGGDNWHELDRFAGPADDQAYQDISYDILDYASADTVIRFRTSSVFSNYDDLYIDWLEIETSTRKDSAFPRLVNADQLHEIGIDGEGVGVAIIDTGVIYHSLITDRADRTPRAMAVYDAIKDRELLTEQMRDAYGHGTHVTTIISNPTQNPWGNYNGIAPMADLIIVRAFGGDGSGSYLDVIRGLEWVLANKDTHNIRVVNLSFSATPQSYYWDDPLNQAVMRLWQEGIVVVAAAGNTGPDPMTIGVPGNVPYIITVGAMTDNYHAGKSKMTIGWQHFHPPARR